MKLNSQRREAEEPFSKMLVWKSFKGHFKKIFLNHRKPRSSNQLPNETLVHRLPQSPSLPTFPSENLPEHRARADKEVQITHNQETDKAPRQPNPTRSRYGLYSYKTIIEEPVLVASQCPAPRGPECSPESSSALQTQRSQPIKPSATGHFPSHESARVLLNLSSGLRTQEPKSAVPLIDLLAQPTFQPGKRQNAATQPGHVTITTPSLAVSRPSSSGPQLVTPTENPSTIDTRKLPKHLKYPNGAPLPRERRSPEKNILNITSVPSVPLSPASRKLDQVVKMFHEVSPSCPQALVKYLKPEVKGANDADWLVLVRWIREWHRAELADLQSILDRRHMIQLEQLNRELGEANAILGARAVEISNQNDDVESLVKDLSEATEELDYRKKELARIQEKQSNTFKQKMTLKKKNQDLQNLLKHTQDFLKQQESLAQEEKKRQEIEDAETQAQHRNALWRIGELTTQADQLASGSNLACTVRLLQTENQMLKNQNSELETGGGQLRISLDDARTRLADAETNASRLQQELKIAHHEAEFMHRINMGYRSAMENKDPTTTAHLNGLLKRKDEAYQMLEEHYNQFAVLLKKERREMRVVREDFSERVAVLKAQNDQRQEALERAAAISHDLQDDWEEVIKMYEGQIFWEDIDRTIKKYYENIRQDNLLLGHMVESAQKRVFPVTKESASLKRKVAELEAIIEDLKESNRQLEAEFRPLQQEKAELEWKEDLGNFEIDEEIARLKAKLHEQEQQTKRLLKEGTSSSVMEELDAKEDEIAGLRQALFQARGMNAQYYHRDLENQDGFCYVYGGGAVYDWTTEENNKRLAIAERLNLVLQKEINTLKERFGIHDQDYREHEGQHMPLAQGQGLEFGPQF